MTTAVHGSQPISSEMRQHAFNHLQQLSMGQTTRSQGISFTHEMWARIEVRLPRPEIRPQPVLSRCWWSGPALPAGDPRAQGGCAGAPYPEHGAGAQEGSTQAPRTPRGRGRRRRSPGAGGASRQKSFAAAPIIGADGGLSEAPQRSPEGSAAGGRGDPRDRPPPRRFSPESIRACRAATAATSSGSPTACAARSTWGPCRSRGGWS